MTRGSEPTASSPDPADTPGLEGGVAPGLTPPGSPQTSGPSAAEPLTRHRFPPSAVALAVALAILALLFVAGAIAIIIRMAT